ncbi:MAG: DUF433 domain-containing protein [Moorellales bacterium]
MIYGAVEVEGVEGLREAVTRIDCNPMVMLGQPVIRGTRLTVAFLLRCLTTMDVTELLKQYPFITREDVVAALEYAAQVLEEAAHEVPAQREC